MSLKTAMFMMLLCMLVSGQVHAQRNRAFLQLEAMPDVDFGVWVAAGSLTNQNDTCISSADTSNHGNHIKDQKLPYQVKLTSLDDASSFYLYKDGQQTNITNRRIAITFYHQDLLGGTEELLQPHTYDQHYHLGQFFDCLDPDNSRLRMVIDSNDLTNAVTGDYQGLFELTASNAGAVLSDTFNVVVSLQSNAEVRISGLDSIDFGSVDAIGDLSTSEHFCVHSSSNNGAYRLSIGGDNQLPDGSFSLAATLTEDTIPLDILFTDSGTGEGVLPVGLASLSGTGDNQSIDCGGSNNATITLQMRGEDLQQSPSGHYAGTLVLLVEPE